MTMMTSNEWFCLLAGITLTVIFMTLVVGHESGFTAQVPCGYVEAKYGFVCSSGSSCAGAVHLFNQDMNQSREYDCVTTNGKVFTVR